MPWPQCSWWPRYGLCSRSDRRGSVPELRLAGNHIVELPYEPHMDPALAMPTVDEDHLHVMILDDEDDYHFITRMMLRQAGFKGRLTAFMDPAEALEHLRCTTERPDLLFVDINMPATDGFQFLADCRNDELLQTDKTMVIMCSSSNRPMDMEMARREGSVHEYIEKPLTPEQFLRLAAEHLQRGHERPTT